MCGIFGYWSNSRMDSHSVLGISKLVFESLDRRGPDGDGGIAIGDKHFLFNSDSNYIPIESDKLLLHSRLAIIDPSEGGNQPMTILNSRYWVVFNGEIFNFKIIRAKLEDLGAKFSSNSDTEVIVIGFDIFGAAIFSKLEGMFAIALYDSSEKKLYLARDQVGIKPLYYSKNNQYKVIFASEQQVLLDSKLVSSSVNWRGVISNYQFNGALRPNTVYENIFAVKPGSYLIISENGFQEEFFANLVKNNFTQVNLSINYNSVIQKLDQITQDAVRSTLISDVEVATLLSGGVDSALLATYASKYLPKLKAYTLIWPQGESSSVSEFEMSREIAKGLELDHRIISVSSNEVEESIEDIFNLYEEPMGMIEPHYFISKALNKDGIKVVLNGIGPDETLGGYGWYRAQEKFIMLNKYKYIFNIFASNSYINIKRKNILNSKDWYEFYTLVFQRFSVTSEDIFRARITNMSNWRNEILESYSDCPLNMTPIQFLNYLDLMVYVGTHHNHSCDKFLMHQGVEGRFPFLNSDWVNFTFWLPDEYKRKNGFSKKIWHDLSNKYFPKNYFRGQKKGFGLPNDLLSKSIKLKNLFEISINQLIAKDIIKSDVRQIFKNINPNEAMSLKLYLLSLHMWLIKVCG